MLERWHELNAINYVVRKEDYDIPLEIRQALKQLTVFALQTKLDDATHFITQLMTEGKTEKMLTLNSMLGCKKHVINNIVRETLIEYFNDLAIERDRESEDERKSRTRA
ncbi:hypothetical protein TUM4644_33300 [Shewanella colwelliana]|uniref:hypothetical protein n=1 Tax=Shewanella colwelliana TaxID=23 RepID=UPI001BC4E081|nr:hypothetical protein [Shewanella colwelliana]GIU32901.1 hypothetical protein TUM4644_33300 [Shewanella colwelliana]